MIEGKSGIYISRYRDLPYRINPDIENERESYKQAI
jgi:hypothetical protein